MLLLSPKNHWFIIFFVLAKHLKTEFIGIKEALETFTDKNLNRLLTNVRDSFGNKASTATIAEVKAVQIKKQ